MASEWLHVVFTLVTCSQVTQSRYASCLNRTSHGIRYLQMPSVPHPNVLLHHNILNWISDHALDMAIEILWHAALYQGFKTSLLRSHLSIHAQPRPSSLQQSLPQITRLQLGLFFSVLHNLEICSRTLITHKAVLLPFLAFGLCWFHSHALLGCVMSSLCSSVPAGYCYTHWKHGLTKHHSGVGKVNILTDFPKTLHIQEPLWWHAMHSLRCL